MKIMKNYDSHARIIPGRFLKVSSLVKSLKITINPQRTNEILINLKNEGWCQNYKIICRNAMIAHYISLEISNRN